MSIQTSHIQENYLKALYHLTADKKEVTVNELAKKMDLKMPSVTSMMKKMADEKLIKYEKYKPVRLTDKGKKLAGLIIRKHRLTEMFLVNVMNFGWEEVHEIAEQIEHIKSSSFFNKMDEMLGFPVRDPHGSVIPDPFGNISEEVHVSLSDVAVGEGVKVIGLAQSEDSFLRFLNSKNIKLGAEMKVLEKEEFDGSIVIEMNKKKISLSSKVADDIYITKESKRSK